MSAYRVSYIRSAGWTRLGLAGAVGCLFASPMMWAMGIFGSGDDALHRALIFGLAGLWFFVATFYVIGWAVQGFVVRLKTTDEEGDDHPASVAPPPRSATPQRGASSPRSGGH